MNPFFESFLKELGSGLAKAIWICLIILLAVAGFSLPRDMITARVILLCLAGLLILALSIYIVYRYRSYRKSKPSFDTITPTVSSQPTIQNANTFLDAQGYSQKPTAREIQIEIDSTPPFQQKAKEASYAGLKVNWITIFKHCHHTGNSRISISMTDPYGVPHVYFEDLDIDKYPQFKIAHTNTKLSFIGTISKIASKGIIVVPDKIILHDPHK